MIVAAGFVAMVVPSTASLGALSPTVVAASSWSISPSPSPPGSAHGQLQSVACTSATNCFAVGRTNGTHTLIERWNGTNWVVVPSPDPVSTSSSVVNNELSGVACATATICFAVGSRDGSTCGPGGCVSGTSVMIQRWNGTGWSLASSSGPGALSGISCSGATSCQAVGVRGASTFAMRWNGAFWATVTTANPPGATASRLSGVKCAAVTSCIAVGSSDTATTTKTLIERWNGTTWSIVTSPNPTGATSSRLNSVACPVTTSCFAVGNSQTTTTSRTLIERWNGTAWSIVTSPNPTVGTPVLSSVGCSGPSLCFAVGSKKTHTLVEKWNGTTWSIVTSPNPVGAQSTRLNGVNCTSTTECLAVGQSDYRSMAQRWNGSAWSIQPDPVGSSRSQLDGVACPSTTSCLAVGSYVPPGATSTRRTLVERWNGTTWAIVATPNPAGSTDSQLLDVDCSSTTLCYAVGTATIGGQQQTLFEKWDGTAWTIVTSPNLAGASRNTLTDIDCTTATNCFAVGSTLTGSQRQTLIEHWDGTAWTIASSADYGRLTGVSCANTSACLAVGDEAGMVYEATTFLYWNGTIWSPVPGPVPAPSEMLTEASAVSCTINACVVVGTFLTDYMPIASCPTISFAARHDGTSWSDDPGAGSCAISPLDIGCTSSADCTTVGVQKNNSRYYNNTVVLHWDGAGWAGVTSPNPINAHYSSLAAVACPSATSCFAVGTSVSDAYQRTLIERYS